MSRTLPRGHEPVALREAEARTIPRPEPCRGSLPRPAALYRRVAPRPCEPPSSPGSQPMVAGNPDWNTDLWPGAASQHTGGLAQQSSRVDQLVEPKSAIAGNQPARPDEGAARWESSDTAAPMSPSVLPPPLRRRHRISTMMATGGVMSAASLLSANRILRDHAALAGKV